MSKERAKECPRKGREGGRKRVQPDKGSAPKDPSVFN